MKNFQRTMLKTLGCAMLLVLARPALAQDQEITVTANMNVPSGFEKVKLVVSIADIDLTTTAGVAKMDKRVSAVIGKFCAPPLRAARWQVKDSKICSDNAWASARPQMNEAVRKARGG